MPQELEKVMEALLQAHVFPDHLTLQREAFRALLLLRPELRIEGAIALYRQGEISFARAAELGMPATAAWPRMPDYPRRRTWRSTRRAIC